MSSHRALVIYVLMLLLAGCWLLWPGLSPDRGVAVAQQPAREKDYMSQYTWQPGGTPEEKLWQVVILLGVGDAVETDWSGRLEVRGGEIHATDGYRFEPPDRVLPQGGWTLQTQSVRVLKGSSLGGHGPSIVENAIVPKGLLLRGSGPSATEVAVKTKQGGFQFRPMAREVGTWTKHLNGGVAVQRVPPATDLSGTELRQHDFPSIATGPAETLWTTWSSYHDRQEELNFRRYQDGRWTRLIPVGRAAEDLWRPHVTTDDTGKPWLIWSQRPSGEGPGNWDIYAMAWEDNEWGELLRLSDNPLPDIEPAVARGGDGTVYVVWQALLGRHSQIRLKYFRGGKWSQTIAMTDSASNNWEPAVAAGDRSAWVVWDRYTSSYDVVVRQFSPEAGLAAERAVASTARFEAHATVAVDSLGRPWIAWETAGVNWGKDTGQVLGPGAPGSPLGGRRHIEVVCLDNNAWKAPATLDPKDPLAAGSTGISRPRLFFDPDGSPWMAFRRRYSRRAFRPSVYWESYLTRLDGDRWTDPVLLPYSWTRKSTRLGLAATRERLWAFWPNENRNWAFASRPLLNRVVAGSLVLPGKGRAPALMPYQPGAAAASPVHPSEADEVRVIRNHRIELGGETLHILRGDLHRHTELSQDQGGLDDGSLPEFYRYMIDAAEMDFGASTDHQAGGTDYWNFLTQKMADMYHFPDRFSTLYAYERNIGNPFGHRNMVYTHRNYPIVPFFQKIDPRFMLPDSPDGELLTFNSMSFGSAIRNDTKLLYDVVRETGGLAIPHTSGTNGMGTDWSDSDPEIDVVVEIYQGARRNYEHVGAPRGPTQAEMDRGRGFQEPGMVWNAWRKGYRIGVITSSDHYSTHISYAMVYAPSTSREDIFRSIRKRHTYGATDNIVLEFWLGDHFMGDDFETTEKQKVRVKVRGTDEVEAVHLIRDARYVYKVEPAKREVEFEYVDNDAGLGEHWYYVRIEQKDGELAWSSPIWVKYR